MKQNLAFLFFTGEWGLFLAIGSTVYTSRRYFVPPLFCIFTCLLSVILSLLFLCCPNFFVDTILRYLRAIERSLFALRARLPRFGGYCFFITESPHPFPILLSPNRADLFSSHVSALLRRSRST